MNELPLYKQIAETYKHQILVGELAPGTFIPSQTDLAAFHKTSEVTVRKALQILVNDGFIIRTRKKGTYVRDASEIQNEQNLFIDPKIKTVYFVYNDVPVSILTQEIHKLMINGIIDVCASHDVRLLLHNSGYANPPQDPSAGYLLWGFEWKSMSIIECWKESGHKMVTLHNYFPHLEIPYVNCDNFTGGYLATQHLLSLGHKHIGIILLGRSQFDIEFEWTLRFQGFNLAMRNNGLIYDHESVYVDHCELEELGYKGFKKIMLLKNRPTAVFAAADFVALGAMKAAEELGISIPDDISIIGYDGYQFGEYTNPSITTVHQNFYNLGKIGLEKLLNRSSQPMESLVAPQLIVRNSTKAI